jgi:hypothetical protein
MACHTLALITAAGLLVWQGLRAMRRGFYRYARKGTQVRGGSACQAACSKRGPPSVWHATYLSFMYSYM